MPHSSPYFNRERKIRQLFNPKEIANMAPGGYASPAVEAAKETTVQSLNRVVVERIAQAESLGSRLETFADRLEPQPRPVGSVEGAPKAPPVANDLQGLGHRLSVLGERFDWLSQIANRLERIA
jgi:hypothetical protein